MNGPASSRALRAVAAFLAAAGVVLAILVAAVVMREIVAPPAHTWSAWTRGAVFAMSLVAIVFCVLGGFLSYRAHRARRDSVRTLLTSEERAQVAAAIRDAEAKTSGEVVVHLAERTHHEPTVEARKAFERIGMARTRERNGVLFFVSVRDHRFAVIGDKGIHTHVAPDFWTGVVTHVESRFAQRRFGDGLAEGIATVAAELARYFPRRTDDVNELPDAMSDDAGDD
ncbi:MAG TPA: TPM domain-containing protein [Candidatus Krumholzibacteria bacterium]|nr:TPM domain-containing protein [Candidatus Krumholzibacteria bacterium]